MAALLPAPPLRDPLVDEHRLITRSWANWLQRLLTVVHAVAATGFSVEIPTPINETITLVYYAIAPFTITGIAQAQTSAGTLTIDVEINGVGVTGLTALAVSAVPIDATATALHRVAVGDTVTLVISAVAGAADFQAAITGTH